MVKKNKCKDSKNIGEHDGEGNTITGYCKQDSLGSKQVNQQTRTNRYKHIPKLSKKKIHTVKILTLN